MEQDVNKGGTMCVFIYRRPRTPPTMVVLVGKGRIQGIRHVVTKPPRGRRGDVDHPDGPPPIQVTLIFEYEYEDECCARADTIHPEGDP